MGSLVIHKEAMAKKVEFKNKKMYIFLVDGRELGVPLSWFPRLENATEEQLKNYRLIGEGIGIHFPDVDEDISVAPLLR